MPTKSAVMLWRCQASNKQVSKGQNMAECLEFSAEIEKLAGALAEFHAKCPAITKQTFNEFGKKYAELGDILSVIRPILAECGLVIMQFPIGAQFELVTMLAHQSGQFVRSTSKIIVNERCTRRANPQTQQVERWEITAQAFGSGLTYQMRYAIGALLSLSLVEDDDGVQAKGRRERGTEKTSSAPDPKRSVQQSLPVDANTTSTPKPAVDVVQPKPMTDAEVQQMQDLIAAAADEAALGKYEKALNVRGLRGEISKDIWATTAFLLLCRWVDVVDPAKLATVFNKIPSYQAKGLLSEEHLKSLTASLEVKATEKK